MSAQPGSQDKCILLVEDEALIAMKEARDLAKEGYRVKTVYNGKAAIKEALSGDDSVDLVLMDIDLGGGIDGTDAAQEILKEKDIPVVFLSSHTEKDVVDKTEKITSYGYVVKDSGMTVLSASIKMAFKLYNANRELRRNEDIIRESEEKYRTLVENIDDVIFRIDKDGHFLYVSPVIEYLFGFNKNEIIGRNFIDYVHPEDREYLLASFENTKSGRLEPAEFRIYDRKGIIRHVRTSSRIVRESGEEETLIGIITDISERKLADEKVRAALRQMNDIIEFLPDPTFVIDREKKVVAWNKAMELLTGVHKADMLARSDYAYAVPFYGGPRPILIDYFDFSEDELRNKYHYIKNVDGTIYAETYVPHLLHEGGAHLWGAASALFDHSGERIGAIEVIRDITKRKLMEDELVSTLAKYRTLFNSFPLGVVISDDAGVIIETNSIAVDLLGLPADMGPDFRIDNYLANIIRPDGSPMPTDELAGVRALREKRMVDDLTVGIVKPSGETTWVNATAVPLDIKGYGVIIIYKDIGGTKNP